MKLSLTKIFIFLFVISIPFEGLSQKDKNDKKGVHISLRGIFGGDKTERIQKRKTRGEARKARKKKKGLNKTSSYSIEKKLKNRNSFFRRLFAKDKSLREKRREERKQRRLDRKESKARKKAGKKERKAVKKYQKSRNKPDYMHTDKSAYKKMKKTKRTQKRQSKDKYREPWIKRIFNKKHKTDKPKRDKAERSRRYKEPFYKRIFKNTKKRRIH